MKQVVLLFIFFMSVTRGAAQNFLIENAQYTITSETTVTFSKMNGFPKAFVIPSTVTYNSKQYTVTAIGNSAFENSALLQTISIPNTITEIGVKAFNACRDLTEITIPNSVVTIGESAFETCSSLVSVKIPSSVTSVGKRFLMSCHELKSVEFLNSITTIPEMSFLHCSNLESVVFPKSLTTIEATAFYGTNLSSVIIPGSVTTIGENGFGFNFLLKSVNIPSSLTSLSNAVFNGSSLTSVVCDSPVPLPITANFFKGVPLYNCILEVPASSVAAYKAHEEWSKFKSIVAKGTLGQTDFSSQKEVVAYPNPFSDEITLELKEKNTAQIEMIDCTGKVLLSQTLNPDGRIETHHLTSGLYFLKVSSENGSTIKKMIKQ